MSHELRTPLNAVIGYTEMVQEELDDHPPLAHLQPSRDGPLTDHPSPGDEVGELARVVLQHDADAIQLLRGGVARRPERRGPLPHPGRGPTLPLRSQRIASGPDAVRPHPELGAHPAHRAGTRGEGCRVAGHGAHGCTPASADVPVRST